MSRCPEEEQIIDFLLGELDPQEQASIESHLPGCDRCRTVAQEHRALRQRFERPPLDAPPGLNEAVMSRLRAEAGPRAAPPGPSTSILFRLMGALGAVAALGLIMMTLRPPARIDVSQVTPPPATPENAATPVTPESPVLASSAAPTAAASTSPEVGFVLARLSGSRGMMRVEQPPSVRSADVTALVVGTRIVGEKGSRAEARWGESGTLSFEGPGRMVLEKGGVTLEGGNLLCDLAVLAHGFSVRAGNLEVRVVGTRFTVKMRKRDEVHVAVERGKVEVHDRTSMSVTHLTAGQSRDWPFSGSSSLPSPDVTSLTPESPAPTETPGAAGTIREGF